MSIKILCPDPDSFSEKGLTFAQSFAQLTAKSLSQDEFEKIAPQYDAVLVRFNTKVGSNIFGKNSSVKAVISPTTGLDHIDMESAKLHGIEVFHLRGEKRFLKGVSGTAELTVGLMLSVLRKIPQSFSAVKNGAWETGPYRGNEVSGKTLGVIGCGRLGSKVCRTAVALGMKVIAFDPYIKIFPLGVEPMKTQIDLFKQSDIVSLHVPLSDETKHLISDLEINQMKEGVIIINTSRGAILKTGALIDGLNREQVSAAALDVLEDEHLMKGDLHPLVEHACKFDNLLITPHIGGATFESVEKTDLFILRKYFKKIRVNYE
jgi:D-3-phosphoglycerate dehydrogenase / 2-oxoglutarate reductase